MRHEWRPRSSDTLRRAMSGKGIGRTRRKLAVLLTEATGRKFSPEHLWPTQGWQRTSRNPLNDSYRWSAGSNDKMMVVDSYETMTECVRRGITLVQTGQCGIGWEVYAR
jgi:hypothetical protein